MELPELLEFLKATDIYVATSLNENQTVSGTFSYAFGCGRAIISTKFAQAREYISKNVGILVDFNSPRAYKEALLSLLIDPKRRYEMHKNAYVQTRGMVWQNVAILYVDEFLQLVLPDTTSASFKRPQGRQRTNSQFGLTFSKLTTALALLLIRPSLLTK